MNIKVYDVEHTIEVKVCYVYAVEKANGRISKIYCLSAKDFSFTPEIEFIEMNVIEARNNIINKKCIIFAGELEKENGIPLLRNLTMVTPCKREDNTPYIKTADDAKESNNLEKFPLPTDTKIKNIIEEIDTLSFFR